MLRSKSSDDRCIMRSTSQFILQEQCVSAQRAAPKLKSQAQLCYDNRLRRHCLYSCQYASGVSSSGTLHQRTPQGLMVSFISTLPITTTLLLPIRRPSRAMSRSTSNCSTSPSRTLRAFHPTFSHYPSKCCSFNWLGQSCHPAKMWSIASVAIASKSASSQGVLREAAYDTG